MTETKIHGADLTLYEETFKNNLKAYYIPIPNKKEYFISYITKFGSNTISYQNGKTTVNLPLGIAHFLEHKNFEQEDNITPFDYYNKHGSEVNALTTYDYTEYYCTGTNDFENDLDYLIKFVNMPYYTEENVLKEQGIIAQELKMYNDNPNYIINKTLLKSVFKTHPVRNDIGGTIQSIKEITPKKLYDCFKTFYTSDNMFIVVTGNIDVDKASIIINKRINDLLRKPKYTIKNIEEQDNINIKKKTIEGNIEVPKLYIGLKINRNHLGKYNDFELKQYLNILNILLFGKTTKFIEDTNNDNLFLDFYSYTQTVDNFTILMIKAISNDYNKLINRIENEFNNIEINKKDFERSKKVIISNFIKDTTNINVVNDLVVTNIINNNMIPTDFIKIIKNLKYDTLLKIIKKIDFNNKSIVIMEKNI